MKKLLAVILILALLLPAAAALADTNSFYIVKHYTLNINGNSGQLVAGKGGKVFEFDSFTVDLYLDAEGKNGYYMETTCMDGLFLSNGTYSCRVADTMHGPRLVLSSGENLAIEFDDENDSVWLQFARGWFRLQLAPSFDMYSDWK